MIRKVERAGGVVYQAYGTKNGKKFYIGTALSEREAKELIEDHRVTQRKISRGELAPQTDERLTFGEAVKRWLKSLEDNPDTKGHRSWEEYSDRIDLHMKPRFEHVSIVDITKQDVKAWRDGLSRSSISASTVNTLIGTLSSAFSYFVDQDWLTSSPCRRLKTLEVTPKKFPWLQTSEAITRLLSELRPNIRNIIAVLVGTGMRLDEALHLHWDDIDLVHRVIVVHRGRKGKTKSGKARHVPIFDSVLPVLTAMKVARGTNTMLWPGGNPGKALSQPTVRIAFKDAVDRAGLPRRLRVHDMRHTFASLFLADGGDIFKLSRILGHSSVTVTEKIYSHLKPTAYTEDYGRVAFSMPSEGKVIPFAAVQR